MRVLDLFCCQGGASAGYLAAGFMEVVGVDLAPQPRYPYEFVQADALEYLAAHGREFDFVHASPPCQARTKAQKIQGRQHPRLIAPVRALLAELGVPYVIENVPTEGTDDDPLISPVELCGTMFGLRTYRHRLFESSIPLTSLPAHPVHYARTVKMGRQVAEGEFYHAVGNFSNVAYARQDMGVPWMTRDGIRECIPPVYAEYIGRQILKELNGS